MFWKNAAQRLKPDSHEFFGTVKCLSLSSHVEDKDSKHKDVPHHNLAVFRIPLTDYDTWLIKF